MNIKKKPCKSMGKSKGFEGCGEPQFNRKYGLGIVCGCYSKWLLETPEGQDLLKTHTLKATKTSRDFKVFEEEEARLKSIKWLLINTRNACHTYIKLRDEGKPCISCGMPYNTSFQAGHFYKAETFSNIKFNEFNINGQCKGCNLHKEGNESEYRVNLPKRIGQDAFDEINRLAREYKQSNFKWHKDELNKIRTHYINKAKEL